MNKYCPECGVKNPEEANFCKSCGKKIEIINSQNNIPFKQINNNSISPQYNGEIQPYNKIKKPFSKNKLITGIAVMSIVSILFGALLVSGFFYNEDINEPYTNKIHVKGGPKANIESIISGGNALTTPEVGHTAIYGYYIGGIKIGEISFTSIGEEIYGGAQCDKIIGDGNFNFNIYGQSLDADFDISAYISKSDGILAYCRYGFNFNEPYTMDMDMILDIDKDEGEIIVTMDSSFIESTSTVIKTSQEYWDCTILKDDLYVGYLKEVTYTMNVMGYDTEVTLKISVIGKEDVTVKKGTFEDCYIIQIDQEQNYAITTSKIWINDEGICPKMQIGGSAAYSISYEGMSIELEEYYTTE